MKYIKENIAVIILAAGKGTRMKSSKAKVLHEILGVPMIMYVVETARSVVGNNVILVIGHQAEKVRGMVSERHRAIFALQKKQQGTGDAVLCAIPHLPDHIEEVVILCGDVPMLTTDTVKRLIKDHIQEERDISLLAVEIDNPLGYGRVLFDENRSVLGIVEEADATEEQKEIKTINSGIYCVKKSFLIDSLQKINSNNAQGELYLTDIVEIGYREKKVVGVMVCSDIKELIGVNSHQDLILVETIMRNRSSIKS